MDRAHNSNYGPLCGCFRLHPVYGVSAKAVWSVHLRSPDLSPSDPKLIVSWKAVPVILSKMHVRLPALHNLREPHKDCLLTCLHVAKPFLDCLSYDFLL
jgi:hypothetical protein